MQGGEDQGLAQLGREGLERCVQARHGLAADAGRFRPRGGVRDLLGGLRRQAYQGEGAPAHRLATATVAALVEGDAAQPDLEGPLGIIAAKRAPGGGEALLHHVVGVLGGAHVPADEQVQPGLVSSHQRGEGRLAPPQHIPDEFRVAGALGAHGGERISAMITRSSKSGRCCSVSTWRTSST